MTLIKVGNGVLFKNTKSTNEKAPQYTGNFTFDSGDKYQISAWLRDTKNGGKYFSISINVDDGQGKPKPEPKANAIAGDDDQVPF